MDLNEYKRKKLDKELTNEIEKLKKIKDLKTINITQHKINKLINKLRKR